MVCNWEFKSKFITPFKFFFSLEIHTSFAFCFITLQAIPWDTRNTHTNTQLLFIPVGNISEARIANLESREAAHSPSSPPHKLPYGRVNLETRTVHLATPLIDVNLSPTIRTMHTRRKRLANQRQHSDPFLSWKSREYQSQYFWVQTLPLSTTTTTTTIDNNLVLNNAQTLFLRIWKGCVVHVCVLCFVFCLNESGIVANESKYCLLCC